ncbi:MAG: DUF2157 domain-containing protein [Kiritimatiellaeota bacterium]|nr:DUF2157 domain-containing protein [Kiritimatiellota bacterium]
MKHEQWLLNLLPQWREEGLVTPEAADVLRRRYARDERAPLWFIFLGSLGALLVGLGVITLFAANWKDIGRPARAALSFAPLCLSVALHGAGLWRGWDKRNGFLEALGIFWGLSAGACVALIAQTYQISSDGRTFTLVWTLLLLPVLYATRSFVVAAGHYSGLLVWMIMSHEVAHTQHLWALPMALLGLPVAVHIMRARPERKARGIFLRWFLLATGLVAYGFVFNYRVFSAGVTFYFFMYGVLFAVLAQLGFLRPDDTEWGRRPWGVIGMLGSLVVVSLFAFGSYFTRELLFFDGWRNTGIFAAMLLLLATVCGVAVARWRKGRKNMFYPLAYGVAPVFCLQWFRVPETFWRTETETSLEALLYLVALGIFTLVCGISDRRLGRANLGLLILLGVILERFLESSLPLTAKAVVFLVAGAGFFALSFVMRKRLSGRTSP